MNWIQRKIYDWYMRQMFKLVRRFVVPALPEPMRRMVETDCARADADREAPIVIPHGLFELPYQCLYCGHSRDEHLNRPDLIMVGCRVWIEAQKRYCPCVWRGVSSQYIDPESCNQ